MKFKLLYIVLLLLAVSCQNDDWGVDNQLVKIYVDQPSLTRVAFSGNESVTNASWEENDKIHLYSKDQGELIYKVSKTNDGGSIELLPDRESLKAKDGDVIYAYFCDNRFAESDKTQVPVKCMDTGLKSGFLYAKARVENNSLRLSFRHLFAYIKLSLTKEAFLSGKIPDNINLIALRGEDTLQIEGVFDLTTEKLTVENANGSISYMIDSKHIQPDNVTCYIPIYPQSAGKTITIGYGDTSHNNFDLFSRVVPKGGFLAGHVYSLNTGSESMVEELSLQRKALEALYWATDGEHWKNNTNWLSEKPIHEWYGVNNNRWGGVWESPYVLRLDLQDNGLSGHLPEEFAVLMNTAERIEISGNYLWGVIPEKIRMHGKWNMFGWSMLKQIGLFDMTNINLRADDMPVEYLEGGTTTLYSLLEQNKISYIMIDTPSDGVANIHLSYHNKGLGTIIFHSGGIGESREDTYERTQKYPIKDMTRLWESAGSQLGIGLDALGSTYLLDDKGYVIDYLTRVWDIPESQYNAYVDSILRARLGEPEEHPTFSTEYYVSTDYSRDGEVVTLQKATQGKGIDLVLMGDAYVDRDMKDGGKYEEDMRKAMDYFFAIEPYKSFRNRFNVYAVKVVSGTEYMSNKIEKMQLRLGVFNETGTDYFENDKLCFEYAGNIEGVDLNKVTIVNVVNNPNLFKVSGFANMYDSGSSIAHIFMGGPSEIIVHESGGHGFAKLLDEYLTGSDTVTEEERKEFNVSYTSKGWGANLDLTDSPAEIKWAHMLADPLYRNEVGIYEGAWHWLLGAYRPSENSVMNNDYSWFNAPSREAIYKAVMKLSEGDGWTYNYQDFVDFDAINRNKVSTRSSMKKDNRKVIHRIPTYVSGTWRNVALRKKQNVMIPLR